MNCWGPKVEISTAHNPKKSVPGKGNTHPCTPSKRCLWDNVLDVTVPSHTPRELLEHHTKSWLSRVFLSTANYTVNVLCLGRSPTSSVNGEIIQRSFECWSDTSCVSESFKEEMHKSGGIVCVGFDKVEFTNTGWRSSPKFCYISPCVAVYHSVQKSRNVQTNPQPSWNSGLALGEVDSDLEPYQTESNFKSSFIAIYL